MSKIKAGERVAIIQSLRNGVVPRKGLQHIQVGRTRELEQINNDLGIVVQGGATMRFIIGDYGAGKTFFLNLSKLEALQKGLVVMSADVTNDRRLQGGGGQAVSLFSELTRNMATRNRPDGGALKSVIERFISDAVAEGEKADKSPRDVIRARLTELSELVAGFDFADVLNAYYEGYEAQNEALQQAALKWLRGEFTSKQDARKALGVRTMVDDDTVFDHIKLFARFCTLAGYKGLLVQLDELMSVYNLASSPARLQNYEQLLRILNDVNQGSAEYLAIMLGGTPEFLEDKRRGLYSHEPLLTRLAPNQFAKNGLVDFAHPVMHLSQLTRTDLTALLEKIRTVFAEGSQKALIDDAGIAAFIESTCRKLGDEAFRTPRETVKGFVELLSMLEQNPDLGWASVMQDGQPRVSSPSVPKSIKGAALDQLSAIRL